MKQTNPRYLTAPLGKYFIRGFIPHSIRDTDSASEVAPIYGVSIATARMWIRVLKGPQVTHRGRIVSKWTPPDFGSPKKKRKSK